MARQGIHQKSGLKGVQNTPKACRIANARLEEILRENGLTWNDLTTTRTGPATTETEVATARKLRRPEGE